MDRKYISVLGLAIVLIGIGVSTQGRAQPQSSMPSAAAECCVGVVDFVRVFNDCLQIQHLNELIQKKEASLQAEAKTRSEAIEDKKAELSAFQPGTPDFESRRQQLVHLTIEANVWLKAMEEDLERRKFDWTRVVYEKAVKASGEIAEQGGLKIILQSKEFNPEGIEPTVAAIRRVIRERELVYSDQSLDITDQVIRRLDEQYEAEGGRKTLWPDEEPKKPSP